MGTSREVITELTYENHQGIIVFCSIRLVLVTTVKIKTQHEFLNKINLYCNLLETQKIELHFPHFVNALK
jgi:hypothetical protein